jgi:DNA helicase II / ATP-dependent DNA helicase PcrA
MLNDGQRRAVDHRGGHLLILAGAGTGKTRTLVARLAARLEEGVAPHRLLVITFTNKAAAELKARLRVAVGGAADSIVCGTFHGVALRWMRRFSFGPTDFIIFDETDARSVAKGLITDEAGLTPGALIKGLEQRRLNAEGHIPVWDKAQRVAERLLVDYRSALERAGAVDFMGLLEGAAALADDGRFDGWFDEVMVDEFQDTDGLQHRLLHRLAQGGAQVIAVGDDDQAIYGWRGADVRGILRFEKDYEGAEVVRLTENYRSTANILGAANRVIANNQERLGKDLVPTAGEGEAVEAIRVDDGRAEARLVRKTVERLQREEAIAPGETCVLVRTNAQLRPIEAALASAGVGYKVRGGKALFETKPVRDLLAYLRLAVQPASDPDLLRIINRPTRGLGKVGVGRLLEAAGGAPLLPWLRQNPDAAKGRAKKGVTELLELFEDLPSDPISALDHLLHEGGYLDYVLADDPARGPEREAQIEALMSSAQGLAQEDLAEFVTGWSLAGGADLSRGEGVQLMTLHAAKGLEFDAVILPGWDEGLFPMPDQDGGGLERLEEERRLAYVGLTRAKRRVVVVSADYRIHHGKPLNGRPSRFLTEMEGPGVSWWRDDSLLGLRPGGGPTPVRQTVSRRRIASSDDDYVQVDYGDLEGGVYVPGCQVCHSTFGTGRVIDVRGTGTSANIDVRFEDGQKKTIRASFLSPQMEDFGA